MGFSLDKSLTGATVILALIGSVVTGAWIVDERYAKAADTERQITQVTDLYLQSERRALRKEKFDLENAAQRRPLTPLERRRLEEVGAEMRSLERQSETIRRGR